MLSYVIYFFTTVTGFLLLTLIHNMTFNGNILSSYYRNKQTFDIKSYEL